MIKLTNALTAWGTHDFNAVLKAELENLDAALLPLQQGMSQSSYVSGDHFNVMIINTLDAADVIRVKAGVFYNGVIAGCNCADDPTPIDEQTEYCEVGFEIDKVTGVAEVRLLAG